MSCTTVITMSPRRKSLIGKVLICEAFIECFVVPVVVVVVVGTGRASFSSGSSWFPRFSFRITVSFPSQSITIFLLFWEITLPLIIVHFSSAGSDFKQWFTPRPTAALAYMLVPTGTPFFFRHFPFSRSPKVGGWWRDFWIFLKFSKLISKKNEIRTRI